MSSARASHSFVALAPTLSFLGSLLASLLTSLLGASAALLAAPAALAQAGPSLYWGDTHVHSAYSLDANLFNNVALGPDVAYRFAQGLPIEVAPGQVAQLDRPLDFLVVSDHAEYMGVFKMIRDDHPAVADSETAAKVKRLMVENPIFGPEDINALNQLLDGDPMATDETLQRIVWHDVVDLAERYDDPGRFTTIVGYEWGSTPGGDNLHRNVLFRDGPERTKRILPFSAVHSDRPEDLWAWLARYEAETGGQAFAIPHNPNLSNGRMFAPESSDGAPIDADWARSRARYEPVLEVTQIKGDSETHPFLSPDDEFADYERWDATNIFGLAKTEPSMHAGSYARAALKTGLEVEARLGVNPFRFAMIGSTDAHTSLATADEDNYWGKTANMPPGSERMLGAFIRAVPDGAKDTMNWEQAAAGYAGVWADVNTRDGIFDAMRRGEVYATTGPRMTVQLFGGWAFAPGDAQGPAPSEAGRRDGVPMGADFPAAPASGGAPRFLVLAARDPLAGALQRAQIVKGWLDAEGVARERVFDVAVAADPLAGRAEIKAVWADPDFDPASPAFYYLRVLEVPTPRWNAIDAARHGTPLAGQRTVHQERAYTSPIWYRPSPRGDEPGAAAAGS